MEETVATMHGLIDDDGTSIFVVPDLVRSQQGLDGVHELWDDSKFGFYSLPECRGCDIYVMEKDLG